MSSNPEFNARFRAHLQAEAQKKVDRDDALRQHQEAAGRKLRAQELYASLACPNQVGETDYSGYADIVVQVCREARDMRLADGPPDLALDADDASAVARNLLLLGFASDSSAIADILRHYHDLPDGGMAVVARLLGMVERDILKLTPDGGDALLQKVYPLVGYRVFNRDRLPERKGQSEEEQKLYRKGFPTDWWLGWERAEKWKGETVTVHPFPFGAAAAAIFCYLITAWPIPNTTALTAAATALASPSWKLASAISKPNFAISSINSSPHPRPDRSFLRHLLLPKNPPAKNRADNPAIRPT